MILHPVNEPSMVPQSLQVSLRHSSSLIAQSVDLRDSFASGREVPEMIWCMIKRFLFASIIFGATICLTSAQDAQVSVDMIGIGSMSCAHWRTTNTHLLEGTVWLHGFWTGLNYVAAASGQTQPRINVSSIVAEVEKACAKKTSQTLASAVWSTKLAGRSSWA